MSKGLERKDANLNPFGIKTVFTVLMAYKVPHQRRSVGGYGIAFIIRSPLRGDILILSFMSVCTSVRLTL